MEKDKEIPTGCKAISIVAVLGVIATFLYGFYKICEKLIDWIWS